MVTKSKKQDSSIRSSKKSAKTKSVKAKREPLITEVESIEQPTEAPTEVVKSVGKALVRGSDDHRRYSRENKLR